jgi:hypothetical protein
MTRTLRASTRRDVTSMATDMPAWLQGARKDMQSRMHSPKFKPRPIGGTLPGQASEVQAKAVRSATATGGHNTFRPDVYRVSEGYLS